MFWLGFISIFLLFFSFVLYQLRFEIEGDCNTGFIGFDMMGKFENEPYPYQMAVSPSCKDNTCNYDIYQNFTKYDIEWLPQSLNLKNIDGMNCHLKVKGSGLLFGLMS